eukprot:446164-Amphidinium_carterae.1
MPTLLCVSPASTAASQGDSGYVQLRGDSGYVQQCCTHAALCKRQRCRPLEQPSATTLSSQMLRPSQQIPPKIRIQ